MRLGNYNTLISLRQPAQTRNEMGEQVTTYTEVVRPYASIKPVGQVENVRNGGTVTATTCTIRIHYRDDVQSTWRITWRGKTLQIQSVVDVENQHRELEIIATETGGAA